MSTQVQHRRGTTAQHATFTGALAEITVDTDKKTIILHDGVTAGGIQLLRVGTNGNVAVSFGTGALTAGAASVTTLSASGVITTGSGATTSAGLQIGYGAVSGWAGLWSTASTIGMSTTYVLANNAGTGNTLLNSVGASSTVGIAVNGSTVGSFSSTGLAVTGALSASGLLSGIINSATAAAPSARFGNQNGASNRGVWIGAASDGNALIQGFRPSDGSTSGYELSLGYNGAKIATVTNTGLTVTGIVTPEADNTRTLGTGALRWSVVYAGTGAINTSDAREKTEVLSLTQDELSAAKQLAKEIGVYRWLSAVESKGESARKHIGMTVQRAIEIMQANNLDPMSYGFICYDQWDDAFVEHTATEDKEAWIEQTQVAGDRYSFRMDELNMFIARGFEARLAALEAA